MKHKFVKLYIVSFFMILGLLIFPNIVKAENYTSDYIKITDKSYAYKSKELSLSDIHFNKDSYNIGDVNSYGVLIGNIDNLTDKYMSVYLTIDYYDENYKTLARATKTEQLTSLYKTHIINIELADKDLIDDSNLDDIEYFKIKYYTTKSNNSIDPDNEENIDNPTYNSLKPSQNGKYSSFDYLIDKYDININVNENNTLDITEKITAYFNIPRHGIYRTIPFKNSITRLDGTKTRNRVQISNLSVNDNYTTSKEKGNLKIKIGSVGEVLSGSHEYIIKYTYNLGKDPLKDIDELYFNIIGTDWDTAIGGVSFTINMPKDFDKNKLGFSSGSYGSLDNDSIKYNVNGKTITGQYIGILNRFNALTVRCELPEGYFVDAGIPINIIDYLVFIIPMIFLILSIFIWYKYGRDNKVIETVEFYPPNGFNSLEVGFLYKGHTNNIDVISLLIYLANKGYIKIIETEKKSLFSKNKGFKIIKLKEYDGNNINEKIFLKGLFRKKPSIESLLNNEIDDDKPDDFTEVTSDDLYDNFYLTINRINKNINSKDNKNKIFEKSASAKVIFILLMIFMTFCLMTIPPVFAYDNMENLIIALVFPSIGFTAMFAMFFSNDNALNVNGKETNSPIGTKIFAFFWGSIFGGIPWAYCVFPALSQDSIYILGYCIGLICVAGMAWCLTFMPKRTPYGNEMLGKIRGFKNYLLTVEKDKLEEMVIKDPTYFYNILPYTYVLGISKKWIKKFESISIQSPSWYDSPNSFDMVTFGVFMNSTMTSAENTMGSSYSSSSGGSSGGGFSGGGSGGGGGGSW